MSAGDAPVPRSSSGRLSNTRLALVLGCVALAIYVLFVANGLSAG